MTKSGESWALSAAGVLLTAVMTTAEDTEPKREILQRHDTSSFAFASTLQGEDSLRTGEWVLSKDEKYEGQTSWVKVERCDLEGKFSADYGLLLDDSHKHYAVGAPFPKPIANDGKDLVIQYEVQMRNGANCGGAYIKMLRAPAGEKMDELKNDSPYSIMFGPDKCFRETNKVHFIFQHQNPLTLEWEEKHLENAPKIKDDQGYHLYTLHVKADNTFEIFIDAESAVKGNLLEDFKPPVNPPKEIDDPDDTQPDDWVTQKKIQDPSETKPDDWDEDAPRRIVDESATIPDGWLEDVEVTIPDPESKRPDDWDDEEDGEWEPVMIPNPVCESAPGCGKWEKPLILNPDYKGVWKPTMIDNPDYKGPWEPRKIENPNYYEDLQPSKMAPLTGLAVEIWSVDGGVWMDNFVVGYDISAALGLAEQTWRPKFDIYEAEAAEEKKRKDKERKEKKNKKDKSNSVLLSTSRRLADSVRPYLPPSAAPVVDQMAESPLACLGTLLAGLLLVVVLMSSSRRRRESSAPRRNAVPASVLPAEPAPEDDNADASKGEGVAEAKEGQEQAADASTEGSEAAEPGKDAGDKMPEVAEKASGTPTD